MQTFENMQKNYREIIQQAYAAFNRRDIPAVLKLMDVYVQWPNGWEGGYVHGHQAVHDYWNRQWKEINPSVEPVTVTEREDGKVEVAVHQVAKNMQGQLLFDGIVKHVYTFKDGLIIQMDIAS